jgi:hypothetical protein
MTAGSRYTDQQRREAILLFLLHGTWRKVAELARIPQRTLNDWALQPWFGTLLAEVRAEKGNELDGGFTRIIHEATEQLLDRLKNGDAVVIGGKVHRKPISARDLALVTAITYDKRALARNQPVADPAIELSNEELLRSLKAYAMAKDGRLDGENSRQKQL